MKSQNPTTTSDGDAFILPEDIRYKCLMDGACCRDTWEIRVEGEAAERIMDSDWRSCTDLPEKVRSPFVRSRTRAKHLLFRRNGEACCFLGEENKCRLHEKYGFEFKPHVCRRFPWRFIQTPGGVYVGLSFACNSVLRDEGPPVSQSREEALWIYEHAPEHQTIRQPILLDAKTEIDWESYLLIEAVLDQIFGYEEENFATCLVAGHVWLGMLRRLIETVLYEAGEQKKNREPNPDEKAELIRQSIINFIHKTQEDGYRRAWAIAKKPVANAALKRMTLGTFLSFRNSLRPRQWRITALARVIFQNVRHLLRVGSLRMKPLEKRVSWSKLDPKPEVLFPEESQKLLRRYYRHALFRKDLIAHTDLFWGYGYFLLAYGLMEYYASGLEALGEADNALALSLVEKYFVHHSSFNQTFLYHPAIAHVFQYLFRRPNFAHTIVYG